MSYLSLSFVAFVAVVALLYYILPKSWRGVILLGASVVFYALFDAKYLLFLFFTALSTFLTARFIHKFKRKNLVVSLCILLNAGVWFYIKELPWALKTFFRVLNVVGIEGSSPTLSLIVPVGISYFTLQAIAYLIDVSKGKVEAEHRFWKYLLFLSWFPAIVQGPISRYEQLMPQLLNKDKFSYERMRSSLVLILFGLVKKMVIADRIGIFANYCFSNHAELRGVILYLGAVGYAIQLYADFSGCVDICRGVSSLFGVDMINNFNRPYLSGSIKEFWSKWHISLSNWLKDYVYISLGGNRKGNIRKYLNIIVTFLVSGLWHGAGFQFFIWGLLHAVYQIVGAVTMPLRKKVKAVIGVKEGSVSERIYQVIITFNLVTLAWIFFRSSGAATAIEYIKNMFSAFEPWVLFDGSLFTCGISQNAFTLLVTHIIALFTIELCAKKQGNSVLAVLNTHLVIRWVIYIVLIFDILLFGVYGSGYDMAGFLYGGF